MFSGIEHENRFLNLVSWIRNDWPLLDVLIRYVKKTYFKKSLLIDDIFKIYFSDKHLMFSTLLACGRKEVAW